MNGDPKTVSVMSRDSIQTAAEFFRECFDLKPGKAVNMVNLLEKVLPRVFSGFTLLVEPDEDMPGVDGVTASSGDPTIWLSNSIYERLCVGDAHANYVAAHELGHLFLHSDQTPGYAKKNQYDERIDPEWQADRFAEMWLMPADGVRRCRSASHVAAKYNVPDDIAERRFNEVKFYQEIQGELF